MLAPHSRTQTLNSVHLSWINPTSHYVYEGWMHFFDRYAEFTMYDEAFTPVTAGRHIPISHAWGFSFFGSGVNFIRDKKGIYAQTKNDFVIVGEYTCFDLAAWYLFSPRAAYYSEFFFRPLHETWLRKLLFYLTVLPAVRKKFIVPTKKSYDSYRRITSRVLYFPQLYYGKTKSNSTLARKEMRLLIVGYIDDWKKNYGFFIEALALAVERNLLGPVHLDIAGGSRSGDTSLLKRIPVPYTYHKHIGRKELSSVYAKANVFVQPSLIDPIGAVVLEAMAHSLPLIVSANVGSADYSDKRGSICVDPKNKESIVRALVAFSHPKRRVAAGNHNRSLVEKHHAFTNTALLDRRWRELLAFLNS